MLELLLLAFTALASLTSAAPDQRLEPAPQLTEVSTLGLATVPLASLMPQDPFPPGTTPPTCQELLDQIAALEVEIGQLMARSDAAHAGYEFLLDLFYAAGCDDPVWNTEYGPIGGPTPACQSLLDAALALLDMAQEAYEEAQAKELALQQLIGLLAVYC